jgi:pimeloyl-ACP methyl ester carboxylesterase
MTWVGDFVGLMVSNFSMDSANSPLVLMHGLAMSGNAWREVVPLVSGHHRVYAPTADGHRGGSAAPRRPATMADMVDAAERYLDECGLDRPHLAGNSMGGLVAIELARRGRAASVCAFSRGASGRQETDSNIEHSADCNAAWRSVASRVRSCLSSTDPLGCADSSWATWSPTEIESLPPGL